MLLTILLALRFAGVDSVPPKTADSVRIPIPRTTHPPVLDGRLDDPIWKDAARLTGFVQYEPADQSPPTQKSVGYVAYDANYFYFAFHATEPSRGNVRATLFPRERGGESDDRVTILLDTFNDQRRAYEFRSTPLGIQTDGVKVEGQQADISVDFVWYSAGRVDEDGWSVEMMIPWASLRFPAGDTIAIGFNAVRVYGRTGERDAWAPRHRGNPCDICQEGVLTGITGVSARRTLDLLPYVAASQRGARAFVDTTFGTNSASVPRAFALQPAERSLGGDARLALTPAIVLNATLNPDFSQVESDEEQVRVNQRFALSFQERRPFFLEGRDVFETGRDPGNGGGGELGDLFYSRAIVDPTTGARLTAKQGGFALGALYARDDAPAYWWNDGYQSSSYETAVERQADVAVIRARRDVLESSYFGVIGLGRRLGASTSAVGGADLSLRKGAVTLRGEVAHSADRAPLLVTTDTVVTTDSLGASQTSYRQDSSVVLDGAVRTGDYYRARLSRSGYRLNWSASAAGASPRFRNQLGRFQRVGIERFSGRLSLAQYPNSRLIQRVEQSVNLSRTNAYRGGALDWSRSPELSIQFQRQTFLNLSFHQEHVSLPRTVEGRTENVPLDLAGAGINMSSELSQRLSGGIFLFGGQREIYDPSNPRVGAGYFGNVRLTVRPISSATIELRGQRSIHREHWGDVLVDDARILRLRTSYQFTRALGVRGIGEYSNQYNRLEPNPLSQRTVRVSSSALITYEMAPGSFLYAGYSDTRRDFDDPIVSGGGLLRTGSELFAKVSYLWRL
ncbi:MAG: carbohydrate binding family 9 domain-containing protein [Gemmatimonadota bacterium]|nr:carbohydrate binding family 9 domain-containing protein [Gemmatimonadota bacterium]